jgi:uncharacterized protein (TIGR04255 family)
MKTRSRGRAADLPTKVVSKPLRHPPLSEVAFEVNFPNCFAVETGIARYQQRVEALYPNSGGEYIVRLPAAVAFGKPPRQESAGLTPMRSFVFQNSKGSRTVRVSVVNFTLLVTDYLHFEDYVAALTAAFKPAIEIFQLHNVERIGLRYINQIQIPTNDAEVRYRDYVHSPISEAFSAHVPTSFLTEVLVDLDSIRKLTIRSGLLPPQPDAPTRTYLLDLDCYSLGSVPLSGESLTQLLYQYHAAIESEFMHAVTEGYWKYMAEGKPL